MTAGPWNTSPALDGTILLDAYGQVLVVPSGGLLVFESNDTGPTYPPPPVSGSNAIGSFTIGVSQIGDIPAFDINQTVLNQYANSPILTSIITSFAAALDQTANFQSFYDNIFNVDTAIDVGLDIWGRILDVNRVIQVEETAWFGFEEALPGSLPFNTNVTFNSATGVWSASDTNQGGGTFYTGSNATNNAALSDDAYRLVLLAKAAFNITDCSIPSINRILMSLFPNRGNAYAVEGNMTLTYVFTFPLTPTEYGIIANAGVLPQPSGVVTSISATVQN